MKINIPLILCVILIVEKISARILKQCDIARELLYDYNMPRNEMDDWVCLVLNESAGNTSAVGGPNKNGSYDYGLFQINDNYWCAHGKKGKDCNVECDELITDDITASVTCAKKIYKRQGFNAWHGWTKRCSEGRAPSVDHCYNEQVEKVTEKNEQKQKIDQIKVVEKV